MKKLRGLTPYQKAVLLFMLAMVLAFAVIYPLIIARVGFAYKNSILVPARAGSGMVYSGKIQGKRASFAVSADKTVLFRYGDRTYGPYAVREDPAAVPKDPQLSESMTGVELLRGEEILFRGGVLSQGGNRLLYNSDGSIAGIGIWMTENGSETDPDGNAVDPMR